MKLTTLDEDLKIHQKLEDEPNDVGGLSAQALKEKFDQAGVTIQKYLNETHLPEEERAVEDALSEAKAYTDAKAKTMDQGNMKTAVYDAKKRHRDIFDYTDEKIAQLQTKKMGGTWISSGRCNTYAALGASKIVDLTEVTDPDGLWSPTEKAFVVPEGGRVALMLVQLRGAQQTGSEYLLEFLVNGTERTNFNLGYYTNSTWDMETVTIPLLVEEGDRIAVKAKTIVPEGCGTSQIMVTNVCVVIFA